MLDRPIFRGTPDNLLKHGPVVSGSDPDTIRVQLLFECRDVPNSVRSNRVRNGGVALKFGTFGRELGTFCGNISVSVFTRHERKTTTS